MRNKANFTRELFRSHPPFCLKILGHSGVKLWTVKNRDKLGLLFWAFHIVDSQRLTKFLYYDIANDLNYMHAKGKTR